jgi:hypothetical protein
MKPAYVVLAICAGLSACALEAPSSDEAAKLESQPYDDELDVVAQAVRGGSEVPNGKRGVVQLTTSKGQCTGVLINKFYMLTAGHCVKSVLGNAYEGEFWGWVEYYKDSGTVPVLLHDTGAPMYAWVVPTYQGSLDTPSDLALVSSWRSGAGWPIVTKSDFAPISEGSCPQIDLLQFYGRGYDAFAWTGSGTLRTMPINVKDCFTHYYFDLRGDAAICHGDSGGPYFVKLANGVEAVAGLFSNAEGLDDHACSSPVGARQRAVRLKSKIQWLEARMGFACVSRSSNGHPFKECF